MVNNEPDASVPHASNARDTPATMRSALLDRNSPDFQARQRRRRGAQQVRFKDLEDEGCAEPGGRTSAERRRLGAGPGSPHPNRKSPAHLPAYGRRQAGGKATGKEVTVNGSSVVGAVRGDMVAAIDAVTAVLARAPPHPLTPAPTRRALALPPHQAPPNSITLPLPRRPCLSTAIQTSPSLQKPLLLPGYQTRCQSLEDICGKEGQEDGDVGGVPNHVPASAPGQLPSYFNSHVGCPQEAGRYNHGPQAVTASPKLFIKTKRSGTPPTPPPRRDSASCTPSCKMTGSNGPAHISSPSPSRRQCLGKALSDPGNEPLTPASSTGVTGVVLERERGPPSTPKGSPARGSRESERGSPKAHPTLPLPAAPLCPHRTADTPLTPDQAETLRQVQKLLGSLVSGARGQGSRGPLKDVQGLRARLQSLEGLLETSQSTVRVLLDAIHDLEANDAPTHRSYRTGQGIEGCGTLTDNACVIYSVENDFRLQEGKFTESWMMVDPKDSDHSSSPVAPLPPPVPAPLREDPSPPDRPPHTAKKGRRKCFWFL
ncbi:hypothetical protein MATL_G00063690 [Megalops atlanticus]|uniref:Uncharacterized protein n=1 Tax=Megalops atlanticus TaxID=7932 RepID=A0A9D3Q7F3_MEGAT|nr:hypothetical protein MATL_G00063690 [Megalops atlanticus]